MDITEEKHESIDIELEDGGVLTVTGVTPKGERGYPEYWLLTLRHPELDTMTTKVPDDLMYSLKTAVQEIGG